MSAVSASAAATPPSPVDEPGQTGLAPVEPGQLDLPLRATLLAPELPGDRALVPGPPRQRALATRAWHVQAQAVRSRLPVRYLGSMPVFGGHRVYSGSRTDWVLLNVADDPLLGDRHGFPIPEHILKELRRTAREIDFDAVFVAHEVPRGAIAEDRPLPAEAVLPPPPRTVQGLSAGLGAAGVVLWSFAALPPVGSGLLASLLAGATALLGGASLDPVLLGVVTAPNRPADPGEPAAWFYLGHWAYNAE